MIKERFTSKKRLIRLYDQSNMLGSILAFSKQIESVFLDNQLNQLSIDKQKIDNVVVVGMGSSLIAFKIIEAVFRDNFTMPIFINNTYMLPEWVNCNSLIIISSYSGNSEETIVCAKEALNRESMIIGITTGGKLKEILKNKCDFLYLIDPSQYNPCQQPRLAIGYSLASYLQIFLRTHLIKFTLNDIKLRLLIQNLEKFIDDTKFHRKAFEYAKQLLEKNIHIIAADFLTGNAELFAKQLQWNAKQESSFSIIPEAAHHISESVTHPRSQRKNRVFIFLESSFLSSKAQDTISVLKNYLTKLRFHWISVSVTGETKLIQAIDMMTISALVSYYMALLYREDPTPTPGIKFYKRQMR